LENVNAAFNTATNFGIGFKAGQFTMSNQRPAVFLNGRKGRRFSDNRKGGVTI
jgi:hypothetical protein